MEYYWLLENEITLDGRKYFLIGEGLENVVGVGDDSENHTRRQACA